jgi:hypothetical protein
MEAGIHGFGHGEFSKNPQLSDALVLTDTKTHVVSNKTTTASASQNKFVADSYTNAEGKTTVSRPDAHAIVTTRDDLIHAHLERTATSTSLRKGDTTKTHTDAASNIHESDHATIVGPNGAVTTADTNRTVTADTTADNTVKSDAKDGTAKSTSASQTDFTINADGTIVDSHGNKITLSEVAHGDTVSTSDGASQSTSSTTAQTTHDGRTTHTTGTTTTKSTSQSDRDSKTTYEGVLSSTTANGKTTTRYLDYVIEEDVSTKASATTVDQFSAEGAGATQKSGKAGASVTQTIDATSDSQSAALSGRSDSVHASSKPEKDGDATVVSSSDHVDAQSVRATSFQTDVHIVTDNGAVQTTTGRAVTGQTVAATQTHAAVHSSVSTEKKPGGIIQFVQRTTEAQSEVEAQTSYDAATASSSSNGASSQRTDHVTSQTAYDINRITKYVAYVRTVVTQAAATATFAASA